MAEFPEKFELGLSGVLVSALTREHLDEIGKATGATVLAKILLEGKNALIEQARSGGVDLASSYLK